MFNPPIFLRKDAYKLGHPRQYPEYTTHVYDNDTARGSRILGLEKVVPFGLQAGIQLNFIDKMTEFFDTPVDQVCAEFEQFVDRFMGPGNGVGSDHLRALHNLGYLPLEVWAVPEGTPLPLRMPMWTCENTHPDFYWLPNDFETIMSNTTWMPTTSATTAWRYRLFLDKMIKDQEADPAMAQWICHDFSMRGMSSLEAAAGSGAGHLLSFTGTDTLPAVLFVDYYYPGDDNGLVGASVPATEHAVMMAGGELSEIDTFRRLMQLYPEGILSIVSDTWDYWRVLTEILPQLKDEIMARNGKIVIRPDSGDPVQILAGDPFAPMGSPQFKGTMQVLWELFGGTETPKGYQVLDPHIGVIYGDSITFERFTQTLMLWAQQGFAATNGVFGIGSFTYQFVTRDTLGQAIKATWARITRLVVESP
jgi:nicotinamide phosphoribosyltransferase